MASKSKSKAKTKNKEKSKYVSSNSKFNRYEKLKDNYDDIDLSVTKQQQLVFDDIDLDATINLDTSFMDKNNKKKVKKVVEEVIEPIDSDIDDKKSKAWIVITLLVILCLLLIGFIAYHYLYFDHNKEKVVIKEKKVVETIVDDNYLFLGDSITEQYDLDKFFDDYKVVNSGVSGDYTSSILKDMKKRVYDYNPSKIFLLIGINDLRAGKDNEKIISNVEEIIKLIKENRPYSEIYLESIYPINKTDDDIVLDNVREIKFDNSEIAYVNSLLEELALDLDVVYVDLFNKLIDDDGNFSVSYTKDGLHVSDKGYDVITNELMKYIED